MGTVLAKPCPYPKAHYPNFSASPRHGFLFHPPPKSQKTAPCLVIMGEKVLKDSPEKPGHQDSRSSITQLTLIPSSGESNHSALFKDMSLVFPSTCSEIQSSEILAIQERFFFFSSGTSQQVHFSFPLQHFWVCNTTCSPLSPLASPAIHLPAARLTQCYVDYVEGEDVDGEE